MITIDHLASSLHLFVAILMLGLLWHRWRSYRIDALRQRLFAQRDALFDLAAAGTIGYDHKAYRLLRLRLNGMIRFAHRISFARLFLSLVFFCSSSPEVLQRQRKEWLEALQTVPADVRKTLLEVDQQMNVSVVQHMVSGSPVLIIFLGVFLLLAGCSVAFVHLWEMVSSRVPGLDLLEAQALQAEPV